MIGKGENNYFVQTNYLFDILDTIENTGSNNYYVQRNSIIIMYKKIQEAVFCGFSFFYNNYFVYTCTNKLIIYKGNKKIKKVKR